MTTQEKLNAVIALHEKMRNAYFFTSPCSAGYRRSFEKKNSMETEFDHNGDHIVIEQETSCSGKHVYYKMRISINDEYTSKDIRFVKKLLKELGIVK